LNTLVGKKSEILSLLEFVYISECSNEEEIRGLIFVVEYTNEKHYHLYILDDMAHLK